jgi:hypothetical protein
MVICEFCQDFISDDSIQPCVCNKFYHPACINHLVRLDDKPLGLSQCNECQMIYQYDYKSACHRKLHFTFSRISVRYLSLYVLFCAVGTLLIGLCNGKDFVITGLALTNVVFVLCSWLTILITYLFLKLKPITEIIFGNFICLLMVTLLATTPIGWLDWTFIAVSSALVARTKKYWFVLSSEYPYIQITDTSSSIQFNDI